MTTQDHAVQVQDLHKTYKGGWFGRSVHALKGVSLNVEKGEIFGLLGPNGAGKTTLIKILLDIVLKSSGDAHLFGRNHRDRRARIHVGYLPEHYRIPRHHTGISAIAHYGALCNLPREHVRRRLDELIELVGLKGRETSPVHTYSKGMQQRLGLAIAMIHDPELLILDEPTDGVDPVGRKDIREIFLELKQRGKTVFINSHLLQETELVCERVAILVQGQLRHVGAVDALTGATGDRVVITIAGECANDPHEILGKAVQSVEDGRIILKITEQEKLDAAVDRLRAAGISIAGISKEKRTLETAFLQLVEGEEKS